MFTCDGGVICHAHTTVTVTLRHGNHSSNVSAMTITDVHVKVGRERIAVFIEVVVTKEVDLSTQESTYIQTYIHAYIHTYIHTHIHTYIHTYVCTYVHTYLCASSLLCSKCKSVSTYIVLLQIRVVVLYTCTIKYTDCDVFVRYISSGNTHTHTRQEDNIHISCKVSVQKPLSGSTKLGCKSTKSLHQ